jgi:hypothetical protein
VSLPISPHEQRKIKNQQSKIENGMKGTRTLTKSLQDFYAANYIITP